MLFLNASTLFCFSGFAFFFYTSLIISILLYVLPTLGENHFNHFSSFNNKSNFYYLKGTSLASWFTQVYFLVGLIFSYCCFLENSIWMGHVVLTSFTKKIIFLLIVVFLLYLYSFFSSAFFSSREIFDFLMVKINSLLWLYVLFLSNSILSSFFVIEVLSALLFLMLVSSSFSSLTYYSSLDNSAHQFLGNVIPSTFLKSIIFFFWVSLIASLNLFVFTLIMYTKLFSLDWYLLEHAFFYVVQTSSYSSTMLLGLMWYILIFSIFTKCGLAPFFFWKPTFFKGLTFTSIFYYICIFYFSLFLFFINFITNNFHFIFYFFHNIFIVLVILGLFMVLFLVLEAFYLKTFLAISSILNSLMLFLAMSSSHVGDLALTL